MQYRPQPFVQCGDPGEPDLCDLPALPASIQSDWHVADTLQDVQKWLAGQRTTSSAV